MAPAAPKPAAMPSTLPMLSVGKASAITTLSEYSQLRQTALAMLKMARVAAALGRCGVSAQTGPRAAMLVSMSLRARTGGRPRFTIQSDQAALPTPPRPPARKGIQPTWPVCASVRPDCSCR